MYAPSPTESITILPSVSELFKIAFDMLPAIPPMFMSPPDE